ncbi:fungal specific transcription factor [Penicillium digitatum]|uniref:Fungal specific transcription factor n=1 Tax=Penicillium digitatum TaxID=36651 RepID=A0A7T6XGP9_PENDI|nr:fungal specific transcription factor [Penicillium digitatum]
MKLSAMIFTVFALASTGIAAKTCTPSFDYCSDVLLQDKGFTEADLKDALKGSDLENEDLENILFHCKNPGDIGHPKLCTSGCENPATEGSHSCSA